MQGGLREEIDVVTQDHPPRRSRLLIALLLVFGWWLGLRVFFFEGLQGADDLEHVIYALQWDHLPQNHWETRLFFNALLHASIRVFGPSQAVYALPGALGSLVLLVATTLCGYRRWGVSGLLSAGLLVASLPLDVIHAAVPSAHPLAAGLAAAGTALLLWNSSWLWSGAAALVLALAVLAHPAYVFFAFALCGPRILFGLDNPQRLAAAACVVLTVAFYFALELAVYKAVTGDPLYEIKLLERLGPEQGVLDPDYSLFSPGWFLFPLWSFCFSRQFGLMVFLGTAGVLIFRKRLTREDLCLALTCLALWAWIGYGSFKPTAYVPFWRTVDYNYALAMPVCLCVTALLMLWRGGRVAVMSVLLGLHVLMLSSLGVWGQGIKISNEMLGYVKAKPATHFLTDRLTNRELFALNGCRRLANVSVYGRGSDRPPQGAALVYLWNPLNQPTRPAGLSLGKAEFATKPRLRLIAYLLPGQLGAGREVLVRRPSGEALDVLAADRPVHRN